MTWQAAISAVEIFFFAYFAALNLVYLALNLVAARVIRRETEASTSWDAKDLSALVPPVSIIVPGYDEEATIAESGPLHAFGLFRRSVVIEAGGYATDTVGEDMELVVRLHRLHRAARKPYRIVFEPDPICWTDLGHHDAHGVVARRCRGDAARGARRIRAGARGRSDAQGVPRLTAAGPRWASLRESDVSAGEDVV